MKARAVEIDAVGAQADDCALSRPRVSIAMLDFDDIGRAESRPLGPKPGRGAVLHYSSGEADFDGLPGDELPLREAVKRKLMEDAPAPLRPAE